MSNKHHKISKGIWFKGVTAYPTDPQNGDLVYRSDLNKLMLYNNSTWTEITLGAGGGGGSTTLVGLTDTNISSPSDQQVLSYNSASGKWINSNLQQRIAYLSDVKANNVAGGSFNAGIWVTRDLNTLTGDTSFVTLSANSFTLKAGVYDIEASSPVYLTNLHKTILVDSNTSAIELHGTNGRSHVTNGGSDRSFIQGTITVVSDKTFEIRHRCSTVKATDGLGIPMGFGIDEVYTQVKITKIK